MYCPIVVHLNILNMAIFWASQLHWVGEDRHVRPLSFCGELNYQQLSFEVFFDLIDTFCTIKKAYKFLW